MQGTGNGNKYKKDSGEKMKKSDELKELVAYERKYKKSVLRDESGGIYPMIYGLVGFSCFMAALCGFYKGMEDMEMGILFPFVVVSYFAIESLERGMFRVMEEGKSVNIIDKYIYTPVDIKMLCRAKLYVYSVDVIKIMAVSQAFSLSARLLDGWSYVYMGRLFLPVIAGCVFILIKYLVVIYKLKQAL